MEPKKKSGKKKRHISKHVLKAREGKTANPEDNNAEQQSDATKAKPVIIKKQEKKKHVKDPSEAAEYLTKWENRESASGWKFNKNTQSWLIRHMYEVDKVPKGTFKILLEYLDGLQGDIMRSRIRTEASRRARRYKEHVKNSSANDDDDDDKPSEGEKKATKDDTTPEGDDKKKNDNKSAATKQELLEEESRWKALDENDKRKEYKRARIILDAFKD